MADDIYVRLEMTAIKEGKIYNRVVDEFVELNELQFEGLEDALVDGLKTLRKEKGVSPNVK